MENEGKHNIVLDGLSEWNIGKYYYRCTKCGKRDSISRKGTLDQLNFYNTICTPTIPKIDVILKTEMENQLKNYTDLEVAYKALQEQHARDMKDKHEYIEMERKRHAIYIEERNEVIKTLKEEIKQLHYTVKGACSEHLHVRMEISPQMLASANEREITRVMTERANKQMAYAVEQQLGDRYQLIKEYDRALRHIFYLEDHASRHCVQFTPFGMPLKFR